VEAFSLDSKGRAKYDDILDGLTALVTVDGEDSSLHTLPGESLDLTIGDSLIFCMNSR
jgi:hypothetical protein